LVIQQQQQIIMLNLIEPQSGLELIELTGQFLQPVCLIQSVFSSVQVELLADIIHSSLMGLIIKFLLEEEMKYKYD
jgi:hypothetical protein